MHRSLPASVRTRHMRLTMCHRKRLNIISLYAYATYFHSQQHARHSALAGALALPSRDVLRGFSRPVISVLISFSAPLDAQSLALTPAAEVPRTLSRRFRTWPSCLGRLDRLALAGLACARRDHEGTARSGKPGRLLPWSFIVVQIPARRGTVPEHADTECICRFFWDENVSCRPPIRSRNEKR